MQILYTLENLVELFRMEPKVIRQLTRLGVLPSLDKKPVRYDKEEIDKWVKAGNLEKHRQGFRHHPRGVWL